MTADQLDAAAQRILLATLAGNYDAAAAAGQSVGEDPRDLAGLVFAMAGLAAAVMVERHHRADDPRATGGYL